MADTLLSALKPLGCIFEAMHLARAPYLLYSRSATPPMHQTVNRCRFTEPRGSSPEKEESDLFELKRASECGGMSAGARQ